MDVCQGYRGESLNRAINCREGDPRRVIAAIAHGIADSHEAVGQACQK